MDTLSRLENAEFKEAFNEFDKVLDLLEADFGPSVVRAPAASI